MQTKTQKNLLFFVEMVGRICFEETLLYEISPSRVVSSYLQRLGLCLGFRVVSQCLTTSRVVSSYLARIQTFAI